MRLQTAAIALASPATSVAAQCALIGPAVAQLMFSVSSRLWLYAQSGNANFVYGATLASAAAHMFVVSELAASRQRPWQAKFLQSVGSEK